MTLEWQVLRGSVRGRLTSVGVLTAIVLGAYLITSSSPPTYTSHVTEEEEIKATMAPLREKTLLDFRGIETCEEMLETGTGQKLHQEYTDELSQYVRMRTIDQQALVAAREKERELMRMLAARLPGVEKICITSVQPFSDLYVWFVSNKKSAIYLLGNSEMDIKGNAYSVLDGKLSKRVRVPIHPVSKAGMDNLSVACDLVIISQMTDEGVWRNMDVLKKISNRKRTYFLFEGYKRGTYLSSIWQTAKKDGLIGELLRCRYKGQGALYDIIGRVDWPLQRKPSRK